MNSTSQLQIDRALRVGEALQADKLHRATFARSVTTVMQRVTNEQSLVVSIEGSWGSGKSSVLAMVEEILNDLPHSERPVVVHFNPWLIGDRDALLRQFLASISKQVKLADHAKVGARVAKELKTYSKAFDVLKFIPGAEPWASMVKSVIESMGNTVEGVAEYKTPDIEERKHALEKALREYPRRIIVLIDDIDRLFPSEVFEMVRIIKAVGDLPNVGYILSWDSSYVSAALEELKVPFAATYLDKVVQVRLPIPALSYSMRATLMDNGLNRLPESARKTYFANGDDRLPMLFHNGLAELMETPRDVVRLHDVVSTIEPALRGEIHLADIIALACLMTKAPAVYRLLQQSPQAFVGRTPGAKSPYESAEKVIQNHTEEREVAFRESSQGKALKEMVHWLFPLVPGPDKDSWSQDVVFTEGHLAHPERLLVALQLSMHPTDVSLVSVQQFLFQPEQRNSIAAGLDEENCFDFLSSLSTLAADLDKAVLANLEDLCVAVARLVDGSAFSKRARNRANIWEMRSSRGAVGAIENLMRHESDESAKSLAEKLITDPTALSVAAELALYSYSDSSSKPDWRLKASEDSRSLILTVLAKNVESALFDGTFFDKSNPSIILWTLARLLPEKCKALFAAVQSHDATGDKFVEVYLRAGVDSVKGQFYRLPTEVQTLEAFISLSELKALAEIRLQNVHLSYPIRAAWRAVAEDAAFYGKDGSMVER